MIVVSEYAKLAKIPTEFNDTPIAPLPKRGKKPKEDKQTGRPAKAAKALQHQ
jgi:hypothetical protein